MSSCAIPVPKKSPTPCSIHVPLFQNEAGAEDFASWPQAVQNLHTREIDRWCKRNPDLDIVEQNHSIDPGRRITVTEFFHAPKGTI
jgi:hypothetical protein